MVTTTDTRLERVKASLRPRFLANGIEPYDYETTATQVERFEDRPRAWADLAREHGHRVDEAEQTGNRVTAGGFRRLAGLGLHFGSFAHPRPVDAWVAAQRQEASLYRGAAP